MLDTIDSIEQSAWWFASGTFHPTSFFHVKNLRFFIPLPSVFEFDNLNEFLIIFFFFFSQFCSQILPWLLQSKSFSIRKKLFVGYQMKICFWFDTTLAFVFSSTIKHAFWVINLHWNCVKRYRRWRKVTWNKCHQKTFYTRLGVEIHSNFCENVTKSVTSLVWLSLNSC